ncbi:hypothetical protein PHYPSEUDO_010038 [Phytophthora pseudosyringae]|uniref:Uncharacterized protein n=1 Tax=Phytophthora pseudosyringae TaxID=221518 RepID=A0A8T1W8N5_9STRA|nr:hypothetical protein PHYPSEUDO_010038 [Phytophthora pseudosyringae]
MNLRQAQRSLADLVSKCEAAHILLPEDALEARAEAVEAIIHSLKDGKANLNDAQDELQQKYGLEFVWKQHMENEQAKRQRRRQSQQRKGGNRAKDPRISNLGFLPEVPPLKDQSETGAQGHKVFIAKGGVLTPSKRPASSQEAPARQSVSMKIAKKVKNAREMIVPNAAEEKQPPSGKKSAAGLGHILGDDDSSESPDQGIAELLDLEDLDAVEEGGSDMSSGEEIDP